MVVIKPFKGWYYNPLSVGDITKVVTPPHDIISDKERDDFYSKSEYSAARVILPKDGYDAAKRSLEGFAKKGAIIQDKSPAYYVYEQEFDYRGNKTKRLGFFAIVRAEPMGKNILPHEMVFPEKAKDRRELFEVTKANLSPIFGLYADDSSEIGTLLKEARRTNPLFEFEFQDSVNRVWQLYETEAITRLFQDKKIIIADGHHRYTAASQLGGYVLMYLVDLNDQALNVLPTHRLLKHPNFDLDEFLEKASEFFEIEESKDIWALEAALAESKKHTFGVHNKDKSYLLRLKDPNIIEGLVDGDKSRDWKNLEVTVLHNLIMKKIMGDGHEDLTYAKHPNDVIDLIKEGKYDIAFLLRHSDINEVVKIVANKEVMPHKSTYFHPKPLAGLIIKRSE